MAVRSATPRAQPASPAVKPKPRPMTFTGYCVHLCFAFGLLFALARPLIGRVPESGALKHLPLIAFVLAMSVHAIGMAAADGGRLPGRGLVRALWPYLVLGVWATLGSLYARVALHQIDTFLTLGIYLLAMLLVFVWGRERRNGEHVVKPLMTVWLVVAVAAIIGSLVQRERDQPLHESEFLVVPVFLYWYLASAGRPARVLSMIMLVAASVLTGKITGFAIGMCAILYLGGLKIWTTASHRWRGVIYTAGVIALVAALGAAIGAYFHFREYMPSGNARVRMHQYTIVYHEFLASPLWGAAYTGPSGVTFVEAGVPLNIPTHSDVLDLLREGGLLGFGLWLTGLIRSLRMLGSGIAATREAQAFFRVMIFTVLATVFSYCFNPLLLKPPQAFVIWGMLALALSVATDRRPGQLNAP